MTPRLIANMAGLLWLGLAFPLFFLTLILAAFVSQSVVLSAAMGVVALTLSALLFVRGPGKHLFLGSAVLGLMFATVGVAGLFRADGTVPGSLPILIFVAISTTTGLVSLVGRRAKP